jgi:hypothetical protein
MKYDMKKIYLLSLVAALSFTSCDDFLDSENYTGKDSGNYPKTEEDVSQMVSSVYKAAFYQQWQGDYGNSAEKYFAYANLASDDMFGGGGKNDMSTQAMDHLLYTSDNNMEGYWSACYAAIARANAALAAIDNVEDEELRNQTKGELLFLRAFTYFDLAKCFGNIPMLDHSPESVAEAQSSPDQVEPETVFKKVAADLYEATQIMPSYPYDGWSKVAFGKATRWAAEALLARAYLYYTGFFNKDSMPMDEVEGYSATEVTKDYVVECLNDVINNSGFGLLNDYRSLWCYSNPKTAADYDYVSDLAETWSEDNKEAIFSVNFAFRGEWDSQLHMTNQWALFFGLRTDDPGSDTRYYKDNATSVYPFGGGWGCGPVASNLVDDWKKAEPNDMRREASILTFPSGWDYGTMDSGMEVSGYHNKKIGFVRSGGGTYYSFNVELYGSGDQVGHFQASSCQPLVLIRFADVLLMHSELTQTADGINKVRARAGLGSVSYSLTALQNERRWELAFEGLRWDDIRRWHIAPECLAKQVGQPIYNCGTKTVMNDQGDGYAARYNATNGYYRIPGMEVTLAAGTLQQNQGWDGMTGYYGGWN